MAVRLLLIRHSSHLRAVSEQEILATVSSDDQALPRENIMVDTSEFVDDIAAGDWTRSAQYLRRRATEIVAIANSDAHAAGIRYFGLAEIPHVIALGAFLGDERHVDVCDYDRHRDSWTWKSDTQTFGVIARSVPHEVVAQSGDAVIRVAISAPISDTDVTEAVGGDHLADVQIAPAEGAQTTGIVQSPHDVADIRRVFRETLAALMAARPRVERIHLFVAAPVSVCFVLGQELHLRSSVPIQTYRYRKVEGEPSYTDAILLSAAEFSTSMVPLSDDDRAIAARVRESCREALEDVQTFAKVLREGTATPGTAQWWDPLKLPSLADARPFRALPPLWDVVDGRDGVADEPFTGDYGRDKDSRLWRLSDRLLVGLNRAAGGDPVQLRRLIHLFLFHEYLHDHNVLTKYTAAEVGAFPNCLEHIDYAADLYALIHQLSWARHYERKHVESDDKCRDYIAEMIELAIRSFWAFEPAPPVTEWQVRRLRRYLNWYWRRVQAKRAPTLAEALATVSQQPAIELAGLFLRVSGRRVLANLTKALRGEAVSLGVVMENERFARITDSPVFNFDELLRSFREADHDQISLFFNALYEDVNSRGGAFPPQRNSM